MAMAESALEIAPSKRRALTKIFHALWMTQILQIFDALRIRVIGDMRDFKTSLEIPKGSLDTGNRGG